MDDAGERKIWLVIQDMEIVVYQAVGANLKRSLMMENGGRKDGECGYLCTASRAVEEFFASTYRPVWAALGRSSPERRKDVNKQNTVTDHKYLHPLVPVRSTHTIYTTNAKEALLIWI